MAITPQNPGNVAPPNSPTEEAAGSVAIPNSPGSETPGSVAIPIAKTAEAAGSVAIPNSPTEVAAVDVVAPIAKTAETVGAVAIPNSPTALAEGSVVAPVAKTAEAAGAVAIPNSPTAEAAGAVAIPVAKTAEAVQSPAMPNILAPVTAAGFPRALEPLVGMNFAEQLYVQDNRPVLFDDLITYARNSTATFWNRRLDRNNKWESFLDTDYVGSVTNLVKYSEQISHADWIKTNVTVDGELVYPTTAGASRSISQVITATSANHNVAFRVKASGFSWIKIFDAADTNGAWFNISAGTIGTIAGSCEPKIVYAGEGYYDCSIGDAGAASGDARLMLSDADNSTTATTNSLDGVLINRCQAALGLKPLPYIKSISAATTDTFTESLRMEYDPITFAAKGALIEGGDTNLFLRSEEFDNASWTKSNATITANDAVAPDDTTSMDKLKADAGTFSPYLYQQIVSVAAQQYTKSWYVKKSEASLVQITYDTGQVANNPRANFDLINGVLGTVDADITATIKDCGNGIYRITSTITVIGTALRAYLRLIQSSTDTRAQANSWAAGDGVHVWGAQCEANSIATSYNRTEGSAVTRAKDDTTASAIGNANPSIGTIVFEGAPYGDSSATQVAISVNDATANNRVTFQAAGNPNKLRTFIVSDGVSQSDYSSVADWDSNQKNVLAFEQNDITTYVDGVSAGSDASANMPLSFTDIDIGQSSAASSQFYGHIKLINVYEELMTPQEVSLL